MLNEQFKRTVKSTDREIRTLSDGRGRDPAGPRCEIEQLLTMLSQSRSHFQDDWRASMIKGFVPQFEQYLMQYGCTYGNRLSFFQAGLTYF